MPEPTIMVTLSQPATTTRRRMPVRSPQEGSDAELISRLADGDKSALAAVYEVHGGSVMRLARQLTRNATLAEDVTQEVFVRLWRRPTAYDETRGSLRTFLLQHTRGRAIDLIRSESARRIREDKEGWLAPTGRPDVDEEAMATMISDTVKQALDALPGRERRPIELAYYGGHSYREVAELLGEPEGTIKSRIRTGLRRLHDELGGVMA